MASYHPQLKAGVDLQLQSAFAECNWSAVSRLADKRFRALKDPYYEILRLAADAQVGGPSEKVSVVAYVQNLLKDGSPRDVESLELLEWASADLMGDAFFAQAIGPLRVRLVKANPKDRVTAVDCLESCLLHWDLSSAQQIAALLDRTFPQEHRFLFWNIVTTYLYSSSDQCPADKQKLLKELSIKQIQKAAQLSEQAMEAGEAMPARGIHSEEEILLYFDMLESRGDLSQLKEALQGPLLNPLKQFRLGRKETFLRAVTVLSKAKDWQMVYSLIKDCLSEKDERDRPSLLASDWSIWKSLVDAAKNVLSTNPGVFEEVPQLIESHLSVEGLRPIYARTLMLARVLASFELGAIGEPGTTLKPAESARVAQLVSFTESQYDSPSCFQDIKRFIELLGTAEQRHIAYDALPRMAEESSGYKKIAFQVLSLKVRYFIFTTPQGRLGRTDQKGESAGEEATIAAEALRLYRSLETSDSEDARRAQADFLADLAVLSATCLLKAAGVRGRGFTPKSTTFPLLLLAALLLEHQLLKTPKNSGINLLLTRLYLNLGLAKRALSTFDTLEVKRTIVESHSPLFIDRLSGVAPDLASGPLLASTVQSHYANSLRLRMPRKLADAFEAESYTSILQIPKLTDGLRSSCTMVMGFMEEMRAQRMMRLKRGDNLAVPMIAEITRETELSSKVDYGSFPNLESTLQPPLHELLAPGPGVSNTRSHLSILAEQYFSLLTFKPPTVYKPASAAQTSAADHAHVIESLTRFGNSFARFLRSTTSLTQHERIYYNLLYLLTSLTLEAVSSSRSTAPSETFPSLLSSASDALELLLDLTAGQIAADEEPRRSLLILSSLIPISYVRDAASAVLTATAYITSYNDRQLSRDRSGESSLRKETLSGVKGLEAAAREAAKEGSAWIAGVKEVVSRPAFVQQITACVREGEGELEEAIWGVIEEEEVNVWGKKVVDGWRANVEGWGQVRWE